MSRTFQEEAEHISGLINELLSFSKVGMLFDDAKLVPVNVADIVRPRSGT